MNIFEPQRVDGVAHVVAVASGKGGVGKTTVTVSLALALALEGHRVGIFDADVFGPNVPLMLGVTRQRESSGWLPVGRAENKPYIPPLERFGLKVMSMALLVAGAQAVMPDPRFTGLIVTRTLKDVLWGGLDYLLLDLPPGTGEPQQTVIGTLALSGVIIVTTPQEMAQMDAGRGVDMFRKAKVPVLGVVENMSYVACPQCGEKIEVFRRDSRPGILEQVPVLGQIPMHPDLSERITPEHPLVTGTPDPQTAPFREIARSLIALLPLT